MKTGGPVTGPLDHQIHTQRRASSGGADNDRLQIAGSAEADYQRSDRIDRRIRRAAADDNDRVIGGNPLGTYHAINICNRLEPPLTTLAVEHQSHSGVRPRSRQLLRESSFSDHSMHHDAGGESGRTQEAAKRNHAEYAEQDDHDDQFDDRESICPQIWYRTTSRSPE